MKEYEPKPVEVPKDPEPDLSTKPKDIVGYCFGYVCPKKHVQNTFESISVDDFKKREACDRCGAVAKPAVVKRIAEAKWLDNGDLVNFGSYAQYHPQWKWSQRHSGFYGGGIRWTHFEFFQFLETPKPRRKK